MKIYEKLKEIAFNYIIENKLYRLNRTFKIEKYNIQNKQFVKDNKEKFLNYKGEIYLKVRHERKNIFNIIIDEEKMKEAFITEYYIKLGNKFPVKNIKSKTLKI